MTGMFTLFTYLLAFAAALILPFVLFKNPVLALPVAVIGLSLMLLFAGLHLMGHSLLGFLHNLKDGQTTKRN